ncbi:hypothetical protein GCM10025857_62620 [Alicyclobacillus contaminans]|uniref:Uncharacterized protein n=1 Tax=Tetragenococcus osmophilus TaxID=526944 RepID=A0AA37XJP5_9ENTE|nr:hypothetical protein GCM10025857_62620 [Alicyclobacillus contaminans]GMA71296.1 hypothetical protein GCM10025885_03450 [Tetragenococcus osmophilus]
MKVQSQVVTAKRSEPQAEISDDGVKEVVSQIFQAYEQELDEAKWWIRLHIELKSKR